MRFPKSINDEQAINTLNLNKTPWQNTCWISYTDENENGIPTEVTVEWGWVDGFNSSYWREDNKTVEEVLAALERQYSELVFQIHVGTTGYIVNTEVGWMTRFN